MRTDRPVERGSWMRRARTWALGAGTLFATVLIPIFTFLGYPTVRDLADGSPTAAPSTRIAIPTPVTADPDADRRNRADGGSKVVSTDSGDMADRTDASATLTVSPSQLEAGGFWSVEGAGFPPRAYVRIYVDGELWTFLNADNTGEFELNPGQIQQEDCGDHKFEATVQVRGGGEKKVVEKPVRMC